MDKVSLVLDLIIFILMLMILIRIKLNVDNGYTAFGCKK